MDITAVRPQLKHSSVFLQTDDGMFFQSDEVLFLLKGKSIARWISTLSPYMNGEHTIDELCSGLEPAQREMVTRLIETLLQRGVLKDALPETPETLPTHVRRQFSAQIAYIDHFIDQPQQKFKNFRESRVLLVGAGESLTALALSLLRNGLQELFLASTDGIDSHLEPLEAEAVIVRQGGSDVHLSTLDFNPQNELTHLDMYDIVVYCSDNGSLQEIAYLNELCMRAGRPFLSATIFGNSAMIGPLATPHIGPCWLCAQLRLSAHMEENQRAALWKSLALGNDLYSRSAGLFNTMARRIGHGLGFELFKILSGALTSETENGVILQNMENLEASYGKLVQHPLCPVCTQSNPASAVQHLMEIVNNEHDYTLLPDELREKHRQLFDPQTGVFNEFVDEDIQQIPLKRTRITLGQPGSPLLKNLDATAYGIHDVISTYTPAFIEAVRNYSRALPDQRTMQFSSLQEMLVNGRIVIRSQDLATWSGIMPLKADAPIEWLPAFSLFKRCLVYVPAAAVYSHSPLNRLGVFERTSAGSTVATTFRTALTTGILAALGYEHLQVLLRGQATVAQLDIDMLASSEAELAYLVKSARRFERPFDCLKVVDSSLLSVVIVRTTDTVAEHFTTFGIALSDREATKMALLNFVGGLQVLQTEGSLPTDTEELFSGFSQDSEFIYLQPEMKRSAPLEADIQHIEDHLQETGRDVLFVNTTTSDIWNAKAFISGTVLLTLVKSA